MQGRKDEEIGKRKERMKEGWKDGKREERKEGMNERGSNEVI